MVIGKAKASIGEFMSFKEIFEEVTDKMEEIQKKDS